ncbi:hypothetical protein U9M48_040867 [Paspalum notatum var. saurae]|uniref:F-box domain-containing protein n=1 Tax=Paspalum notatum var. saurae TaxID=547442 RepID=A0AAQ3URH3_PASNO
MSGSYHHGHQQEPETETETETMGRTQVGDLPEACLAQVLALTSPRDASRCAAVSPAFRAAADSDHVWAAFLPSPCSSLLLQDQQQQEEEAPPAARGASTSTSRISKKDAYLGLCDAGALVEGGSVRVWLEKATGARCYALSARRLSLPWDDGELSWRWTPHPLSRFAEVAELASCTSVDIYARLPASALTPATPYAAYLVYGVAAEGGHRGLSFPDQETTVAVGGRVVARHAVCLLPDDAEARKFRAVAAGAAGAEAVQTPVVRGDGWWEVEMGRLDPSTVAGDDGGEADRQEVVVASFEVLGWYPKRGLVVEAVEFRPAAAPAVPCHSTTVLAI